MNSQQKILNKFKEKGSKGITCLEFPTGFAFRSRISDLRSNGYNILSKKDNNSRLFRYWLLSGPNEGKG